ncbi:autophagy-related protein 11 [Physcomitrium patens]|uniref:Autophagy-related protein 11 C-terminal domain-containing protein n=1 Tax=Physcomitrium patens TaxID=3218 RepID=A0A7I4BJH1_PHYPA|nr:autophagy-related protein 11-like [Physcomitrium patens]XP_024403661.1 autophagy-related protein 11-like [Physcomitrium patens]XP_024403662.1 autophagy-related protein 11-like [Physcomitrium patens]XP_024403663.1 autophagy-related protein 11-like [Physcomitrium patens]XP_024403664.1 autophagy-related protein 11-like [Physcomitrium patens]XP_024403665.1 autophagy-related protein 11-like [Physcomitrium patens]|eukprot:XP_024403660.1 autophagy-related protein 11-like [Physcomitrella patens]
MLIHVAENGQSFDLDCQPTTNVGVIQNTLVSITGIPLHEQILFCGDTSLRADHALVAYKLPDDNRHVFLYNRSRLIADCPPPPPEDPEVPPRETPPPPSSLNEGHPLDDASDPALKALPSYERQFKYHFQKGHAIFCASQKKFDICRRLLREQQVQEMALETARGNIAYYYKVIDNQFGEFLRQYARQHKQHSDLLANFERDLERLRACKLHPSLRTETRKTLLNCVRESSLRERAEHCSFSHKQFGSKVAELKVVYLDLQRNVQYLFGSPSAVDVHDLERTIEEHIQFTDEQASIVQSLSKDVNTVKKLVDDCVCGQYSGNLRPHDAVSALGPMYDVHDKNHIPRLEACDMELENLLEYCKKSKNKMNLCVHTRLQNVAALQSNIRDMRNQLAVFKEALVRQSDHFAELKLLRRVGPSYKACLAEVVRRKASMKLYMGQAGQLAEKLARKREAEIARREEFLRVQSMYIHREVLQAMGLFEIPSQCIVNIAPFDTNLLDIDVNDIERYAPESLVGRLMKGPDQNPRGSSRSLSNSGFQSSGGSQGTMDALDEQNLDANEDDSGGDEIAGTSKLEVENAWLKSELASAVAMLCNLDPGSGLEEGAGDSQDPGKSAEMERGGRAQNAAQKTAEALHLKDEHAKHLKSMLAMLKVQCNSYEKRIRELEQRLAEQHIQLQKYRSMERHDRRSHVPEEFDQLQEIIEPEQGTSETSGITGDGTGRMQGGVVIPEPMDEGMTSNIQASSTTSINARTDADGGQRRSTREGGDEVMSDVSGGISVMDAGAVDSRKESSAGGVNGNEGLLEVPNDVNAEKEQRDDDVELNGNLVGAGADEIALKEPVVGGNASLRETEQEVSALQTDLLEKNEQLMATDDRLKAAMEEVARLTSELDGNAELLNECQMNCAHLENRLHEAREEARTNLCAADRRAAEYSALRASSVRLRGLMERLRSCITAPVGNPSSFAESLRSLAVSLSSVNVNDGSEDSEFRNAIRVLADRVGNLAQQRAELLERCNIAETNQAHLKRDLENQAELLKSLYSKRKFDKQASKEKICFARFEIHGLAVFLRNANGHFEAINHNCPHYYLSGESIALFQEQGLPSGSPYIVGQIVHIDRKIVIPAPPPPPPPNGTLDGNLQGNELGAGTMLVPARARASHNPYGLPVGTEYYVVTVAMVPDF